MPDESATDDELPETGPRAAELGEDEALRVSDPVRWQLARMDRGAAARRFVTDLGRRYPSTAHPDPAA